MQSVMSKLVLGAAALTAVLARPAHADVWLAGEAPLAVAISDGQRGVFRPGLLPAGGVYLGRGALAVGLRMRAGFLRDGAGPSSDREDPGTGGLISTTVAARLRLGGPWIEATAGGGVTGSQLAPTFELAAGLSFANESFELGPSVRYVQVRSVDEMDAFGSAELLLVGLDVKFGGKPRQRGLRESASRVTLVAPVPKVEPAVAIDRDHLARGRIENGAGIAARAERAVNVDRTVPWLEMIQYRMEQHGDMTVLAAASPARSPQRRLSATLRHVSRAPCPPPSPLPSISRRFPAPKSLRCPCTLSRAWRRRSAKRSGSQI